MLCPEESIPDFLQEHHVKHIHLSEPAAVSMPACNIQYYAMMDVLEPLLLQSTFKTIKDWQKKFIAMGHGPQVAPA